MRVRVLLFAALREAVGQKQLDLELPADATLAELISRLEREHALLARYRGRLLVSLNEERAPFETQLGEGDEIALLPPVSGGSERAWIVAQPLSMDVLLAEVTAPTMGGVATFTGIVRNQARGAEIDHLEYEAYAPMAERELRKITDAVAARWPQVRLALAHRVGRLAIGEAAVMIAAAAPHRAEAFEACRFAIDTLKKTVPIWKKEFATNGAYWVEENP
jgi:molybdopterin synthase catalytic subunit